MRFDIESSCSARADSVVMALGGVRGNAEARGREGVRAVPPAAADDSDDDEASEEARLDRGVEGAFSTCERDDDSLSSIAL